MDLGNLLEGRNLLPFGDPQQFQSPHEELLGGLRILIKGLPSQTGQKGEIVPIPFSDRGKNHSLGINIVELFQLKDRDRLAFLDLDLDLIGKTFLITK